jgi:UDP-N-acetylmuramoyl-tripeptide--D-alanyl-D-alanine ligase
MRKRLRKLLQDTLRLLARLTLKKFKPLVIGVTGTAGKTSTKEAIAIVLGHCGKRVRSAAGNLNTEFGFPLNILGDYSATETALVGNEGPAGHLPEKIWFWVWALVVAAWNLLFMKKEQYPEVLVLEYGADKPGDLDVLLAIATPSIAVMTVIGDIPVHVQAYSEIEGVVSEKQKLVAALGEDGHAILNADEPRVSGMRSKTKGKVMTYGFNEGSDMHITDLEFQVEGGRRATPKPVGMNFHLGRPGDFVSVSVEGALGAPQAYACAAAAAIGGILGFSMAQIGEALAYHRAPSQRLRVISGIEGAIILDDTYNSSPIAVAAALDVMKGLKAKRKIAVLGDMRELGRYEREAHEQVGKWVKEVCQVLVTAGEAGGIIAEAAIVAGMPKESVFHFPSATEAVFPVRDLLKAGDLVLIKASHSLHFEQIVDAVRMGRVVE